MPLHKPLFRKSLLRKSPVRTRALLSANRANALKSTGPRTSRGKHASALNALRHGRRAQLSLCWVPQAGPEGDAFWRFEARLRDAILPLAGQGDQHVFEQALNLWITKRLYDRLAAFADEDRRLRLALGLEPMPATYCCRTRRPGKTVPDWTVTVSIGVAWGRGLGRIQQFATDLAGALADGRPPSRGQRPMPRLPSLHTRLVLTTLGHPYSDNANERDGAARLESGRRNRRTKPECLTKEVSFENEPCHRSPRLSSQTPGGTAEGHEGLAGLVELHTEAALPSDSEAAGQLEQASLRTKPECHREHVASKNVPTFRAWIRRAVSGAKRLFDRRSEGPNEKDAAARREPKPPVNEASYDVAGSVRLRKETG